jgi:hypothetical protein
VTTRVIDNEQAKIVRLIFDLRLRGWGQTTIANYLNGEKVTVNGKEEKRAKVPSPRHDRLTHGKTVKAGEDRVEGGVKASGKWSPAGIRGITARRLYTGWFQWGDVKPTFIKSLVIVPEKQWDEVQRLDKKAGESFRRKNGQLLAPPPRPTGKHWITRVVRCGIVLPTGKTCDGPMRRDVKDGLEYVRCSRTKGHTRRLPIKRATVRIIEEFSKVLQPAFIAARLGEMVKERGSVKRLGKEERATTERNIADLDRQIQRAIAKSLKTDDESMSAAYDREAEGLVLMKRTEEDKLRGAEVLYSFNAEEFSDIVEAVTEDWVKQIKRNPDVIGAVLAKVLAVKLPVVPPADGSREWTYGPAEVDFLPIVREADADKARAIEALMRELNLKQEEIDKAKSRRRGSVPKAPRPENSVRPRSARG